MTVIPKFNFKKRTSAERKKIGLDKVPDNIYAKVKNAPNKQQMEGYDSSIKDISGQPRELKF